MILWLFKKFILTLVMQLGPIGWISLCRNFNFDSSKVLTRSNSPLETTPELKTAFTDNF